MATALALSVTACRGCRDQHPYVPYSIPSESTAAASLPDASTPAPPRPSADKAGAPAEAAIVAPAGLSHWPLEGLALVAPEGTVFLSAIVRDFDGDGAKDAFALVRDREGTGPALVAYAKGAAGLATLAPATVVPPPDLARDPACTDETRLVGVGTRSVLAEVGAVCPAGQAPAPDRWIAILDAVGPSAAVRLAWTVADPPNTGQLAFDAEVSDRDGDGRDDVRLLVSLDGRGPPFEPGPRVTASLIWLDRPAGMSPDPQAAEASFASLASQAATRAVRVKDAPDVPAFAAQVSALWRAVCSEASGARLVGAAGTARIACGALRPIEDLGLSESRAYATMGDGLRAALALDRTERTAVGLRGARVLDTEKAVAQVAPVANAAVVRAVAAVPAVAGGREPAWAALAFEPSGKLLVRTRAGIVRVDPDAGDEATAESVAWRSPVTSPDGAMQWIETYDPCDGFALRATFASGDDLRDVPLPVAPSPGARCSGPRGAPAAAIPVAWTAAGLEAIVEGVPVLVASDLARASTLAAFLDRPAPLGAPVSPDGKTIVAPTRLGLVEKGPARTRMLRAAALEGKYAEERDCVVSNDGAHAACIQAGQAWVGTWN